MSEISDPTIYHRLRIREALKFGEETDAISMLDVMAENLRVRHPNPEPMLKAVAVLRSALLTVRNLCSDGDGVP